MPSRLGFVSAIDAAYTMNLDLNSGPWRMLGETRFPLPTWNTVTTDNPMEDGDNVPAGSFGNRTLNLRLQLRTADRATAYAEIQKLMRQLNQPRNTVVWQPDTGLPPMFARTYRWGAAEDAFDHGLRTGDFRLDIEAEPFFYGPVETCIGSPFTWAMDPTGGSAPCGFEIVGVKGDVETPLWLSVDDPDFDGMAFAIATRRRGQPNAWFAHCESTNGILGLDTTRPGADSAFSGTGSNFIRTSFATATEQTRLELTLPAVAGILAGADWRGQYRVLLRARRYTGAGGSSSDAINVRLRIGGVSLPKVAFPTATTAVRMVDLGIIAIPGFSAGERDGYGPAWPLTARMTAELRAERTSGSAQLDCDTLTLLPSDAECAFVKFSNATVAHVIDGPNRAVYDLASGTGALSSLSGTSGPRLDAGGMPMLSVGDQPTFVMIVPGFSSSVALSIASTASWTARYWPRYLFVRPATT